MVQIVGKYEHVSDENFEEYLKAYTSPKDLAKVEVFMKSKPVIDVKENGGEWILDVTNAGKTSSTKFKLNEPFDELFPHGATFKSVVKREGDVFTFDTDLPDGNKTTRVYQFSDDGITLRLSGTKSSVVAVRKYKRV